MRLRFDDVRVFDPGRGIDARGRSVLVVDDRIESLDAGAPSADRVVPGRGRLLVPGLVDLRVRLSEPGFTRRETIASVARAAARGGYTTVVGLPSCQPTVDRLEVVELVLSRAAAAGGTRIWPAGALTVGREGKRLSEMAKLAAAGCVAFSDVDQPLVDSQLLRYALEHALDVGLPIFSTPDDPSLSLGGVMHEGLISAKLGLRGIPSASELVGASRDVAVAELTRGRLHLGPVTGAATIALVREAKRRGVRVTADTRALHLALSDAAVEGYDTRAKLFPPLRPQADVDAVIAGLADGSLDAVASDHDPQTELDKNTEFDRAAPGAIGLESTLGVVLRLVSEGRLTLHRAISVLTRGPAQVLGREDVGRLTEGGRADLTLIDPVVRWSLAPADLASRSRNTPLLGATLVGRADLVIAGGRVTFDRESP